ncbi:hypothetical protein [Desulfotomaculum sp. 1211_IL3151]|uniref:hypothetical protein n=1 Tax=Desulfotomaculum sp. 1211_IL3151 TaxID=3084055 RepID=UPI002FDB8B75
MSEKHEVSFSGAPLALGITMIIQNFFTPENLIENTLIGLVLIFCGFFYINKWTIDKLQYIKYLFRFVLFFIFPIQLLSFIFNYNSLDTKDSIAIIFLNFLVNTLIFIFLFYKKRQLKLVDKKC